MRQEQLQRSRPTKDEIVNTFENLIGRDDSLSIKIIVSFSPQIQFTD